MADGQVVWFESADLNNSTSQKYFDYPEEDIVMQIGKDAQGNTVIIDRSGFAHVLHEGDSQADLMRQLREN